MIIHCVSFGTLWWLRPGREDASSAKFTSQAAIFNTTGFKQGARERRNWIIAGVVRLNAGTCFDQRIRPEQIQQERFMSPGLERNGSQNRLLLTRKVRAGTPVDMLLVRISCVEYGRISFNSEWRSRGIRVLAASEFHHKQETLLLMPPDGQVATASGNWRCLWTGSTATLTRTAKNA